MQELTRCVAIKLYDFRTIGRGTDGLIKLTLGGMELISEGLRTLLLALEVLRPALTEPGFRNLVVIFAGWVQTSGTHAITEALVVTDVARRLHHERFHRFFSRGTWKPDEFGRLLYLWLVNFLPPDAPIRAAIDDTLAPKKGPAVFGLGTHLDAVRSTKTHKVLAFGHCWVTLAILIPLPFSSRPWALPILFRLYRNEKECTKNGHQFKKKTELAREMLDILVSWAGERTIELAADNAYCNDTVLHGLSLNVTLFGSMRPDAVLTAPPSKKKRKRGGRPSLRGHLLPKPAELANNKSPWLTCKAFLYGQEKTVYYKELVAQWYRASGTRLLRIVVVRTDAGKIGYRVFFCTNPNFTAVQILETYAGRWAIEVCFRELKQLLGFADSSARKRAAVERTAPFVGYVYSTLVLWFTAGVYKTKLATPPIRPWYTHKTGYAFADVLRAAQRVLIHVDVLDLASSLANLAETDTPDCAPSAGRLKRTG